MSTMDTSPDQPALGPSQEGSDHAILVLRMMNEWRKPISMGELAAITGLTADQLKLAARGLKARGRVVVLQHNGITCLQLMHHWRQGNR
jgi:hypothetical protein